ncbi:uncharacterized protein LOC111710690 [Eurytemora carolleeae]|uniref:uncharacterized protein LOC111710690 n=1 Tax=Eurytemora carolleeae TaxID=1294199 RepID=UPI000C7662B9|nr:uncharacterized protein LOC111710690 [Eurytemora carolleeae]|eukprot:XP_023340580.1 uncharacterized protein LOC111710690 [Eurytemora affinis]
MSYNPDQETTRIVSCIAAYTRPLPVFHWSIEDHYLNLNMTVLQQTKTEVIFPKNSYPAGKAWIVTQPIRFTVNPQYDGKELLCTVEHMGYNASVTEEERTVGAFMTVKGPPIPAEDTLNIQGDFIMGEPATLYIPFHAYPVPTKMVFYLADMDMPLTVGQGAVNTTEAGRYSTEGWVQQDVSIVSRNLSNFVFVIYSYKDMST